MSNLTRSMMMGAAGASGDKVYVDDVFSTYLYDGTGSAQTITNGIDLAGEGGLVWNKCRSFDHNHFLTDTVRGVNSQLQSNNTDAASANTDRVTGFLSDGFTLGGNANTNQSGQTFASWSFRKAFGFFDIVTYTGNGASGLRAISHNLGSTPAFIIVKYLDGGSQWYCWHKNLTSKNYYILLNDSGAEGNAGTQVWEATDTTFSIHSGVAGNGVGENYVAYLFADDEPVFGADEDESIIKCGTFNTYSAQPLQVNLGFEPQWVMLKGSSGSSAGTGWEIYNSMTGLAHGAYRRLAANNSGAEVSGAVPVCTANATGFEIENCNSSTTFIYMAIRRPHKPPTAATEVFDDVTYSGTGSARSVANSLSYTDLVWLKRRTSTDRFALTDRLRGGTKYLRSNDNSSEATWSGEALEFDQMDSFGIAGHSSGINNSPGQPYISWNFKRAPGFMDVVAYSGTGSARTVNHNLAAIPELLIVKIRNGTGEPWSVYHSSLGITTGIALNENDAASTSSTFGGSHNASVWWNSTAPTSSVFTVGGAVGTNWSGQTYIAYLFATLSGISKVGSYSGNSGYAINVDCGFSSGARFILIKRTDSTGDWFVYDSARGIVSGNDPYLLLNTTAAEVTNTDYIDPLSSGFTVTSSAPTGLNASGGAYIFLAIA